MKHTFVFTFSSPQSHYSIRMRNEGNTNPPVYDSGISFLCDEDSLNQNNFVQGYFYCGASNFKLSATSA